jgi:uncharacterized membrane protein YkvA (DUF1232 family)
MRRRSKRELLEELRVRTWALVYALKDPGTPWYARAWAAVVVAYALSPIDLIPDFIPVIGLLDDLVLVPLGVALALRMIPRQVWQRSLARARERRPAAGRARWAAAALIVLLWAGLLALVAVLVIRAVS